MQNPSEFLDEAAIMHTIDHEHIVRLYGVVLEPKAAMLVRIFILYVIGIRSRSNFSHRCKQPDVFHVIQSV